MKILGITSNPVNKQAFMHVQYTLGDVETLEDVNTEEDYTLMPTKEIQALVEAVEDNSCDNEECSCGNCECCDDCNCCEEEYPEPLFGGAYYDNEGNFIYIERVMYNAPRTIVFWNDGTKTSSTCGEHDSYNPEMGLAIAVLKKITSSEFTVRTLHDWVPTNTDVNTPTLQTLKGVRKKHKAPEVK